MLKFPGTKRDAVIANVARMIADEHGIKWRPRDPHQASTRENYKALADKILRFIEMNTPH